MSIREKLSKYVCSTLRPFQIKGVQFLEKRHGRAIIGDDMGLGKTIQALSWTAIHPKLRPVCVVCPASLQYNWQDEFWKHARMESEILRGTEAHPPSCDIIIASYSILRPRAKVKVLCSWEEYFCEHPPKILILDECHYCKSPGASRTMACKSLSRCVPYIIPLSGTPIQNRPIEFYPVLNMVDPEEFDSYIRFGLDYCKSESRYGSSGMEFAGCSDPDGLHEKVKNYMIRRKKTEVLKELPEKTRTVIRVDIDNRDEYERAESDFINWVKEKKGSRAATRAARAASLVRINYLKRLAVEGKVKFVVQWIKDFLESGEKLIVFTRHKSVINYLVEHFPKTCIKIDGSVSPKLRQEGKDRFQQDSKCKVAFGHMKSMGEGFTLTAAATILMVELGWHPGEHEQAEDRAHRIGQKNAVNVYYLLGKDTLEENIMNIIYGKSDVCSQVLDGKPVGMVRALEMQLERSDHGRREGKIRSRKRGQYAGA